MANVNIAFPPGGNLMRFAEPHGRAEDFHWSDIANALANNTPGRVGFFDHFVGDALRDEWAADLSTSSTAAMQAGARGLLRLTTHTDDNANATLALGLQWLVSEGWTVFRAAIKQVTAITARGVEVGLSDALSESNGQAFTSHDATPVAVADDAAIFGFNADDAMTTMSAVSVNGGGTPQVSTGLVTPSISAWSHLGVAINAAGDAYFFTGLEPEIVAIHELAVAPTALLTPWISLTNLTAATARTMDVDYAGVYGQIS